MPPLFDTGVERPSLDEEGHSTHGPRFSCPPPMARAVASPSCRLGLPLSYAFAAVLMGIAVLGARAWRMPAAEGLASRAENGPQSAAGAVEASPVVGKVTAMVNCRWGDLNTATTLGANVIRLHHFALESGTLEITYNTGPKVVLVGPALFSPDFCNAGYLLYGKLTVSTPKAAGRPLFRIQTPTAVVMDRGDCVFGVDVSSDAPAANAGGGPRGTQVKTLAMTSRVYVFRGRLEYTWPDPVVRYPVVLLEEREWVRAEIRSDRSRRLDFIKGSKLKEEFVNQWFKGFPIVFGDTKGDGAVRRRSPPS